MKVKCFLMKKNTNHLISKSLAHIFLVFSFLIKTIFHV